MRSRGPIALPSSDREVQVMIVSTNIGIGTFCGGFSMSGLSVAKFLAPKRYPGFAANSIDANSIGATMVRRPCSENIDRRDVESGMVLR